MVMYVFILNSNATDTRVVSLYIKNQRYMQDADDAIFKSNAFKAEV